MVDGSLTFEEACDELEQVGSDETLEYDRGSQAREHFAAIDERRQLAKLHLKAVLEA